MEKETSLEKKCRVPHVQAQTNYQSPHYFIFLGYRVYIAIIRY